MTIRQTNVQTKNCSFIYEDGIELENCNPKGLSSTKALFDYIVEIYLVFEVFAKISSQIMKISKINIADVRHCKYCKKNVKQITLLFVRETNVSIVSYLEEPELFFSFLAK